MPEIVAELFMGLINFFIFRSLQLLSTQHWNLFKLLLFFPLGFIVPMKWYILLGILFSITYITLHGSLDILFVYFICIHSLLFLESIRKSLVNIIDVYKNNSILRTDFFFQISQIAIVNTIEILKINYSFICVNCEHNLITSEVCVKIPKSHNNYN